MRRQGWFCWQDDIDKLLTIESRISEGLAYRKAKYSKPRSHCYSARRDLDQKACPQLPFEPATIEDVISQLSESEEEVVIESLRTEIQDNGTNYPRVKVEPSETRGATHSIESQTSDEIDSGPTELDWEVQKIRFICVSLEVSCMI